MDRDEERPGFFKPFSLQVFNNLTSDQWSEFCALKADDDRIRFVYQLPEVKVVALTEAFKGKDDAESKARKEEGTKAFQAGEFSRAIRLYSRAVASAPFMADGETSELAAVCVANRSACLFRQRQYQLCLEDISVCEQFGYPQHLLYKLLERKARCLLALRQFASAGTAFQQVIKSLEKSNLSRDQKMKWQVDMQQMLQALTKNKKPDGRLETLSWLPRTPDLANGMNSSYPSASCKIGFSSTERDGRFAVCEKPLKVGDVLVVEKAFASVLRPEKQGTHCLQCHTRIRLCVPCPWCSGALFCSLTCRRAALSSHHRYECRILDLLHASGMSVTCLLSLRLATTTSLQQLQDARPHLGSVPDVYRPEEYGNVFNLVSHPDKKTPEQLFPLTLMAVFMLRCLEFQNYFPEAAAAEGDPLSDEGDPLSDEGDPLSDARVFVGTLLLHNIQLVPFNAHEVAELRMKSYSNVSDSENDFIGAAVFPTLALFNHSCDPAIVRYFSGTTVVVRAIKNMKPGEIIAENYGPIFTQKTVTERKKYLLERYEFDCRCNPCIDKWPLFDDMDNSSMKFKCAHCSAPLLVSPETMTPLFTCLSCNHETNIMKALKTLQDTEDTFTAATRDIDTGELDRGMELMMRNLERLDRCLYPPLRDFYLCQQAIRKVMLTYGNRYVGSSSSQ